MIGLIDRMKINKTYFELKNKRQRIISGDIYFPEENQNKLPLLIISHGFKGFKDWGFFPYISSKFAEQGFITICYNFSMNGKPNDDLIVTNLDDFANNTVSSQTEDLHYLINSVVQNSIKEFDLIQKNWNGSIYLMGHSLGGGVSLLVSVIEPKISKIALWASIAKFDRYTGRQKKEWKKKGFLEFKNQQTNQLLKMNVSYLEDVEFNKEKFDLLKLIPQLEKPVLLIHGMQDLTVPLKEAQMLIDADQKNIINNIFIERTGHTFGIEHPFTKTTSALEDAIKSTIDFFRL
ncbi:MAG: alpha/beta hydrolase [bacterium]